MDDLGSFIALALAALALSTAVGFGLQRGRISQLQGRLKESDEELVRKDRRLTEAEAKVGKLETDLAALASVVTGEAHWIAIGMKLDDHHKAATDHWTRDEVLLEAIRDRLPKDQS